jgi:hypothetical protein
MLVSTLQAAASYFARTRLTMTGSGSAPRTRTRHQPTRHHHRRFTVASFESNSTIYSSCMPNTPPTDLTTLTLSRAKGAELKYWIDGANREAGRRVLTKSGKVDELRQKLAAYYGLDLSSPPSDPVQAGPPSCDAEIQKRQWNHLRELGEEWKRAPNSFQLCERQGERSPTP